MPTEPPGLKYMVRMKDVGPIYSEQRNSVEFILLFCETLEPMSRGYDRAIDFEKLQQTVNLFQSE